MKTAPLAIASHQRRQIARGDHDERRDFGRGIDLAAARRHVARDHDCDGA